MEKVTGSNPVGSTELPSNFLRIICICRLGSSFECPGVREARAELNLEQPVEEVAIRGAVQGAGHYDLAGGTEIAHHH